MDSTEGRRDPDRWIWWLVYGVVGAVAAFAFLVSYEHIYSLATAHGQHGVAARLMPLSVDLLIVAASAVLWLQLRAGVELTGLQRFMPRLMLWAGIAATVAANVASGLPSGPVGAVIAAWPGAVFAGLVEMVMVAVRAPAGEAVKETLKTAGQPWVPATAYEAAETAYAASAGSGSPLSDYQLHKRFGITRAQARKICVPAAPGSPAPVASANRLPHGGAGATTRPGRSSPAPGRTPAPAPPPAPGDGRTLAGAGAHPNGDGSHAV
jgi:hypothetical protein